MAAQQADIPRLADHTIYHSGEMERDTDLGERKIFGPLQSLSEVARLSALRELVWRREMLLLPMHSALKAATSETLKLVDCQDRTIGGVSDLSKDWTLIREDWRILASALGSVDICIVTDVQAHFMSFQVQESTNGLESE